MRAPATNVIVHHNQRQPQKNDSQQNRRLHHIEMAEHTNSCCNNCSEIHSKVKRRALSTTTPAVWLAAVCFILICPPHHDSRTAEVWWNNNYNWDLLYGGNDATTSSNLLYYSSSSSNCDKGNIATMMAYAVEVVDEQQEEKQQRNNETDHTGHRQMTETTTTTGEDDTTRNNNNGIPKLLRIKSSTSGTKTTRPNGKSFIPVVVAATDSPNSENNKSTLNEIMSKAGRRSIGGGISGAVAGAIQVVCLMWLRTIINYQCRYGTNFRQALRTLLQNGGIPRLYRGLTFALIQAPLARFVSTAANDGCESLLANLSYTSHWGPGRTTAVASLVVGAWRMLLMPIDTMKTVLQVDSAEGFRCLLRRVRTGRIGVLYQGAIANAVVAIFGHYPWFFTFNLLSTNNWIKAMLPSQLLRNAGIGIVASIVSDTTVNAMRVIKTTKQSLASKHSATYTDTVRVILAADGWAGLFGRGLRTRIFANALQSIVFTVVWRGLSDHWRHNSNRKLLEQNQEDTSSHDPPSSTSTKTSG